MQMLRVNFTMTAPKIIARITPSIRKMAAGFNYYSSQVTHPCWSAFTNINGKEAMERNKIARRELATAYRALDMYKLNEGVCNHLSLMAPAASGSGDSVMLLIPRGVCWSELTASDLIGLNEKMEAVEGGGGEPEITAASIHSGVHNIQPEAIAVMHLHPPYATALGCLKNPELLMVHQNSLRFYKNVAYDNQYSGYALEGSEGERLGKAIGDKDILVMCQHGILSACPTTARAFDCLYYFERAAMFQMIAMSSGSDLQICSEEMCTKTSEDFTKMEDFYADGFFYGVQKALLRQSPHFLD